MTYDLITAKKLSRPYAKAFFQWSIESGNNKDLYSELLACEQLIGQSEELQAFLSSPGVADKSKQKVLLGSVQ